MIDSHLDTPRSRGAGERSKDPSLVTPDEAAVPPSASPTGATPTELRAGCYSLLPLPPRAKYPPPKGWQSHTDAYPIPETGNVAIGTRGELAILITNDEQSTAWAKTNFGPPHVRSVRGAHWYFRARPDQANEANKPTSVGMIELHTKNKYALIPPSIHPNGTPYRWERALPALKDLPEAPDLRDLFHPGGTHHAKLLSMSSACAHAGKNAETIFQELVAYRDAHLTDALAHPDRELLKLAESAYEKFHKDGTTAQAVAEPTAHTSDTPPPQDAPQFPANLFYQVGEDGELKPDHYAFASFFREREAFAVPIERGSFSSGGEFELLRYSGGFYNGKARAYLRGQIELAHSLRGLTARDHTREEIVRSIANTAAYHRDRKTFNPPGLLCLLNGILDTATGKVTPHPAIPPTDYPVFTFKLAVAYDPAATCPLFDKYMEEIQPDPRARKLVLDLMGYCLLSRNPFQKLFALVGDGGNGKSVIKNILTEILGADAVAAESISDVTRLTFNAAQLDGTLVNFSADEQYNRVIRDTSALKKLSGDDEMSVQRKNQHPFKMRYGGKIIILMNRPPPVEDDTYAFWRRVVVIPFPTTFLDAPDPRYPDAPVADPYLMDKLRKEFPGILNRMLQGLLRVQSRSSFDPAGVFTGSRTEWERRANPMKEFVDDNLEVGGNHMIPTTEAYTAYVQWSELKHYQPLPPNIFGKALVNTVRGVYKDRKWYAGKRTYVYCGVGPKQDADQGPENPSKMGVENDPKNASTNPPPKGAENGKNHLGPDLGTEIGTEGVWPEEVVVELATAGQNRPELGPPCFQGDRTDSIDLDGPSSGMCRSIGEIGYVKYIGIKALELGQLGHHPFPLEVISERKNDPKSSSENGPDSAAKTERQDRVVPSPSNPYYYPPGGYAPGAAPVVEIAVEEASGVTIRAGEVYFDPPPPTSSDEARWKAEWEAKGGDPCVVYPSGVLARRFAAPPDNVLYRPPEGVRVVREVPWEVAGNEATITYSDRVTVKRSSGEVLGRFRAGVVA